VDGWTYYCVSDLSVTMHDADAMLPIQPPSHTCALGVRRKRTEPTYADIGLNAFIVPRLFQENILRSPELCSPIGSDAAHLTNYDMTDAL
jgi:hypothetical protein